VSAAALASAAPLPVAISFAPSGDYTVAVSGAPWLASPAGVAPTVCVAGNANVALTFKGLSPASGSDAFGAWSGQTASYVTADASAARVTLTAKNYVGVGGTGAGGDAVAGAVAGAGAVAVMTAAFPDGLDTSGCGSNTQQSTRLPAFDTSAAQAPALGYLSWRGSVLSNTVNAQGLAALNQGGLDCGPVVATNAVTGNSLTWSTLDNHKIVVQTTTGGAPAAITSLWSASRADQIACLSDLCTSDQKADGNYVVQRVEGYGLSASDPRVGTAATIGLVFAWSSAQTDNFVSNSSSALPDASYANMGANGAVLTSAGTPGTTPLQVFKKVYNASHSDWAAVASADGLAWAAAQGYVFQYTAGWVYSSAPEAAGQYAIGLSAAVPAIPANWSYSVLFSGATGGFTAAAYAWGASIQNFYGTYRLPSVTLSDIGYYTDDGAYYYVWEAFNCCDPVHHDPRPWPAEQGLVLVKEDLWQRGVPVAYMQMDDCEFICHAPDPRL
jgi:hypothetical protein